MNATNFTHALWALGIQSLIALPLAFLGWTNAWWIGAASAIAWFISREHAQRECQMSLAKGVPVQALKPWEGFTGWVLDRYLDAGFPMLACTTTAILGGFEWNSMYRLLSP